MRGDGGVNLGEADWLRHPSTVAVIAALVAAGGEDCVRFVGGCVRNSLMQRPVDDLDMATTLLPDAVMAALKAAGIRAVPTGLAHGTVTAVVASQPFEITTLRRDVSTDGRNATVAFTVDWAEDAARRDFTMNALYADAEGRVFDPVGQGLDDLAAGRVVFVGEARTRIREDYLRTLRFFRFHAWYGRGDPDAGALAACAAEVEGLSRLSAERVSRELLKLLAAPDPTHAMRAMQATGVMAALFPEMGSLGDLSGVVRLSDDAVVRLFSLLASDTAGITDFARRLRLSNAVRDRLAEMLIHPGDPDVEPEMDEAGLRLALYGLGRQVVQDRWVLATARTDGVELDAGLMAQIETMAIPVMPVGGRDVSALGVRDGVHMGQVLKAFEQSWIAAGFPEHGHDARLRAVVETSEPGAWVSPPGENG